MTSPAPYVRPCVCGACDFCRRWSSDPAWRRSQIAARPTPPAPLVTAGLARPVRCVHLGIRVEFRGGCGGMRCRHGCEMGLPAVPAGYCQTCAEYEGDFDEDGATGPGWLA